MNTKYKANKKMRIRCGVTMFDLNEGDVVEIKQLDSTYAKVLVDYGAGMMDWMSASSFHVNFSELGE